MSRAQCLHHIWVNFPSKVSPLAVKRCPGSTVRNINVFQPCGQDHGGGHTVSTSMHCINESHSDGVFLVSGIAQPFSVINNYNGDKAHCYGMHNTYIRKLGFQELIREVTKMEGIAGVGTRLPASGLTPLGTRVGCVVPCLPGCL